MAKDNPSHHASPQSRRRITMTDIARLAGVDISTVSRALKGDERVALRTQEQIRKIVAETGYAVNHGARMLRSNKSGQILVMLPNISATFYPEVVEGIEDVTSERGLGVLVGSTREKPEREEALANQLLTGAVDGIILLNGKVPTLARKMPGYAQRMIAVSRPVGDEAISFVSIDHDAAMEVGVRHFLALGHRRIAHIAGPQDSQTFRMRADAYRRTMEGGGAEPQIWIAPRFDLETGYAAMAKLLDDTRGDGKLRPTAIICASDEAAIGAMRAARQENLSVPSDIAFLGFDGIAMGAVNEPPLSTIEIPRREMGRVGALMLLNNMDGTRKSPKYHELPFRLVVRESCGASR